MKFVKKNLSIMLSLMIVITSIITVFPIAHAETITNYDVSEESLENVETSEDYYENLNDLVPGEDYIEGEMIVKYSPTTNSQTLDDLAEEFELTVECDLEEEPNAFDTLSVNDSTDAEGLYVLSFDEKTSVVDLVHEVSAFEEVEYAQPNYIYETCEATPSYTIISEKEAKGEQSQQAMWNTLNVSPEMPTGNGVVVAVIDSGIDLSHPALEGCFWNDNGVVGYNSYTDTEITMNDDTIYTDDHGTHVAGIIAMQQSDEYTCKGIAPDVQIMDLQASHPSGGFSTATLVEAIDWALEHNADVINMSLGSPNFDPTLNLTCNKAARKAVIVAAAGNDGTDKCARYPAIFKSVIGVMAYGGSPYAYDYPGIINNNEALLNANYPATGLMTMSWSSNFDSQENYYDIIAPGVNICSTKARTKDPETGSISSAFEYTFMSGTSMASPIVAGAVAIYMEANPNATPGQIRDAFRQDSGKNVKKYEALSIDDEVVEEEQLLSNQLDITHILSVIPNEEIDSPYIGPNDETFFDFCNFIKLQFDNDFSENEIVTNEDIRLISFLEIKTTNTIRRFADQLSEFYNLIGIKFTGSKITDEAVNLIFQNNTFNNLEILQIENTRISYLEIPVNFSPNLYSVNANSNMNLRGVSKLTSFNNLNKLLMQECMINDVSFLSGLKNIRILDLSDNHITDIEALSNLQTLEQMDLINNYITDISPLNNLDNMWRLYLNNNLISDIADVLLLENLSLIYLDNNFLETQEKNIETILGSKEIIGSKLSTLSIRPFKQIVLAEKLVGYDMCIKRTEKYVKPNVQVFPYDATFKHSVNISSNDDIIYFNPRSKTISYNENYQSEQVMPSVTGTVNYECDSLTGSIDVTFLMPAIESATLEKYTFDESVNENYISIVTTIDTTKIKTKQVYHNAKEYDLFDHNVTYKDYGNERIIKILLDDNYDLTKEIDVSTGDKLGYFDSKSIDDSNTININITGSSVSNIFGNAEKLFLEGLQITGISTNAINSNCNIGTLVLSRDISNIASEAFNNCGISEVYIKNKCSSINENIFDNCPNMLVYVSADSPIKNFTGAVINSDFKYGTVEDTGVVALEGYWGNDEKVIIPPYLGITKIGDGAFSDNHTIRSIDLSKSINDIGNNAFYNCIYLSDIGGHLEIINVGSYSFYKTAVENISLIFYEMSDLENSAFECCENLKTVSLKSAQSIFLNARAFIDCRYLMFINIEKSNAVFVYTSCFENCELLKKFNTVDCKVYLFGEKAFKNCKELSGDFSFSGRSIPEESFYNCESITSIHCSSTVTVNSKAFYGAKSLQEVGLTGALNSCKNDSFDGCNESLTVYSNGEINNTSDVPDFTYNGVKICSDYSLELNSFDNIMLVKYNGNDVDVVMPECLKIYEIGPKAFASNLKIKTVDIADSVHNIDEYAFSPCINLSEVKGGANVRFIRGHVFENCTKLKDFSTFKSVTSIGEYAFASTGIEEYEFVCSTSYLFEGAFYKCSKLKTIKFAGNITNISRKCFYFCNRLERCILNNRCQRIITDAFNFCTSLTQIYIPLSLTSIDSNGLYYKTSVYCDADASWLNEMPIHLRILTIYPNYEIVNGVLLDYQSETGYDYINDSGKRVVDIPNAVEEISNSVFFANDNVDIVNTSKHLLVIGDYAFMDCSVTEILLPETMISIGRSAFNRTGITSIDIPNGITKLEPFFLHCAPIQQVTIPESVTEICNDAFGDCQNLQSVYIPGNINSIDPNAFAGAYKPITLWGNDNSYLMQYANDNSLQNENNVIVCRLGFNIAGDVLNGYTGNDINVQVPTYMQLDSIGDAAFKNNTTVESISIASGIYNIGSECFSGCTSLNSLLIPDDVDCVGENAFYGIPNLTIYCNEGSYIEGYCIENNINVNTDYDISDGVLNAYNGTATNLVIPSNWFITSIGSYAFDSNTSITSVTIPEGVREIGSSAFGGCSALTTVVLPASNNIKLSAVAFADCINLTNIVNSTSITRVGNSAFGYCTSLESIDLSNVETIGAYGFDFCPSLTNVILGTSVTSIWQNAFMDCENIVINCYSNTYAHQYAIDNDIPYILLDETTMSTFLFRRSFESNTTNSSSLENIEERSIPSLEDKLDDYIQRECNGKVYRDNLDDIIAYMVDNGYDNHLI